MYASNRPNAAKSAAPPNLLLRVLSRDMASNENKMSDGGRGRASLGVKVWKSSQKWSVRRSAVRSIAWLGLFGWLLRNADLENVSNRMTDQRGRGCEMVWCVDKEHVSAGYQLCGRKSVGK